MCGLALQLDRVLAVRQTDLINVRPRSSRLVVCLVSVWLEKLTVNAE